MPTVIGRQLIRGPTPINGDNEFDGNTFNEKFLLAIFEVGVGILIGYDARPETEVIKIRLMEPLVLRAGSLEFKIAEKIMVAPVGTSMSELGCMLERCLAVRLTEIARNNS